MCNLIIEKSTIRCVKSEIKKQISSRILRLIKSTRNHYKICAQKTVSLQKTIFNDSGLSRIILFNTNKNNNLLNTFIEKFMKIYLKY